MDSSRRLLNIACLQASPQPDFQSALDLAISLGEEAIANGAEFIATPEYCGGLKTQGSTFAPPSAPEESHPVLNGLRAFAKTKNRFVLIGSIAIDGPDKKILNRSFLIDNDGNIVSRYDKIHLFDINLSEQQSYCESATVRGGNNAVLCQTRSQKWVRQSVMTFASRSSIVSCLNQARKSSLSQPPLPKRPGRPIGMCSTERGL